ncbi:hypothetical protein [Xanthomonas campestris]|uniref:Uncharacterized protein n=1 Tax=Xanthomonas campestris pv. papavericola TaxID=487881 RepID=A0AAJ2X1E3_XANCA|nr:hypothetical protein [Xanthomonas campestris]MEC3887430.1 hypothetical protein [Xanthomonas campestris pv. papavericola]
MRTLLQCCVMAPGGLFDALCHAFIANVVYAANRGAMPSSALRAASPASAEKRSVRVLLTASTDTKHGFSDTEPSLLDPGTQLTN